MNTSKLILAAALLLGTTATISAKTWRLNPNPEAKADFTSIVDAMDDERVEEGDELILDPGQYSACTMAKDNITITGPGYLLSSNTDWHEGRHAEISGNFLYLSKGSTIQGCKVGGVSTPNNDQWNNCTITRCQINSVNIYGKGSKVIGNLITNYLQAHHSNSIVNNNIILGYLNGDDNSIVENNTIICWNDGKNGILYEFKNSVIKNNIVINTSKYTGDDKIPYKAHTIRFNADDNNTIVNNVLSCPEKYADAVYTNNHFVGATLENTFIDNISGDRYLLRDDSVAKGKATDGGDCGAFGGATPYVLSGIPLNMPHIVEALIPSAPTDGKLEIKLKVATQND